MVYIEKYDKEKVYYFQNGSIADYDRVKAIYPGVDNLTYIVYTDYTGDIIILMELLNLKRTEFNIDETLTEEQAIERISEILNGEEPDIEDTTRIADALEDLVVLNMPDEEVE